MHHKLIKSLIPPGARRFRATKKHPLPDGKVDFLVLTNEFLLTCDDIVSYLLSLKPYLHDRSRLLFVASKYSSFSRTDIERCITVSPFEIVRHGKTFWSYYCIARPTTFIQSPLSVSIIVPVRNEKDNIEAIVKRTPSIGTNMEIVFVEGGSTDGTADECKRIIKKYEKQNLKFVQQSQKGKGNAVREGIAVSSHDLIMILDGDMAIAPEALAPIYAAFLRGDAEFITANRLMYPLEKEAMPWINQKMNPFFAFLYSRLFGQPLGDLFGGTKVFRRDDYEKFEQLVPHFETGDTWGDIDFLFGAAKYGCKIVDFPVHYHARLYGVSNMKSFRFGCFLLKVLITARSKFIPPYFS